MSTGEHIHCYCQTNTGGALVCCHCGGSYQTSPPWQTVIVRVPGDGSEHLEYIRENWEHIPDFMWHSVAQVMEMAEKWIKGLK